MKYKWVTACALLVSVVLFIFMQWHLSARPYDAERFASGSSHFSTIARTYAREGLTAVHGLPIGNNPPYGSQPDVYNHWPPLFTIVLSFFFVLFGPTEFVGHLLLLAIFVGIAAVLYRAVRGLAGEVAAAASVIGLTTLPICYEFSRLVQPTTLCILLYVLSAVAFLKAKPGERNYGRWVALSCVFTVLGVATSWEAVYMPPGLIAAALLYRDRSRLRFAIWLLVLAVVAAVAVLGFYAAAMPSMRQDLWHTFLYRAHLAPAYQASGDINVHSIVNRNLYQMSPGPLALIKAFMSDAWGDLGLVALVSIAGCFIYLVRERQSAKDLGFAYCALAAPVVLWYSTMSIQARYNGFELLMAGPLVGLAFGVMVKVVAQWASARAASAKAFVAAPALFAIVFVAMLVLPTRYLLKVWAAPAPTSVLRYAKQIKEFTPPNGVVMSPNAGLVPAFYSDRHVIRGVWTEADVENVIRQAPRVFPGSPVYLALQPEDVATFRPVLAKTTVSKRTDDLVLLQLNAEGHTSGAESSH